MSEKRQFRAIKGTRDILPPDSALWNHVEQTARSVFESYGFGEIRLPIFEETDLFARSIGADTDVVGKEMYTFRDYDASHELEGLWLLIFSAKTPKTYDETMALARQAGRIVVIGRAALDTGQLSKTPENLSALDQIQLYANQLPGLANQGPREVDPAVAALRDAVTNLDLGDKLSLRPEATASVARAYIEHGMYTLPGDVRLYYVGPMFRRERPQKGRYRQFYQIGAEVLGRSDAPAIDAELIEMLTAFLQRSGLAHTKLYINSIGHDADDCRRGYVEKLRRELRKVKDKLGPDSQRRIETNPLRVLDSKVPAEQPIIENLPRISDHLCADCREHFANLKEELNLRGITYQENWRLVRGLDYYTRTTFEVTAAGLGSQNAVCGGGRYDGLVELLGGPPTKGIGFAIGTDRLILALTTTLKHSVPTEEGAATALSLLIQRPDLVVAGTSVGTWDRATVLAQALRKRGLFVYLPRPGTKLPRVFEAAHKLGIRVAILVGETELKGNEYVVRVLQPLVPDSPRDLKIPIQDVVRYSKLVKLRQDLERALARLSTGTESQTRGFVLSRAVQQLTTEGILPSHIATDIRDLMSILNSAVHGKYLAPGSGDWALAAGNLLLNELETMSPAEGQGGA